MLQRLKSFKTFRGHAQSLEDETDSFLLKRKVEVKYDRDILLDYEITEHLGSGKFGEVKKCRELETQQDFAAKMIMIKHDTDYGDVMNEVKIMQLLRHPRLIQLYDVYSMSDRIYLVLELINGGELFERIIDENFDLNESKCGSFMKEILQGVEYIHSQKILHLDLKPENILCLNRTDYKIKIIDFGLARVYDRKDLRVLFGTPEFVAPEIIAYDPVSPASDMWSVGVICYVLLSGLSPFMDDTEAETLNNIMRVTYNFDYPEFDSISSEAKEFIKKLLAKDPRKRLSATDCLSHAWIKNTAKSKRMGQVNQKRLKRYYYRRKWQKAVLAIIALQRMGYVLKRDSETVVDFKGGHEVSSAAFAMSNVFARQPPSRPGTEPGTPRKSSISSTSNAPNKSNNGRTCRPSQKGGRSVSVHTKPPSGSVLRALATEIPSPDPAHNKSSPSTPQSPSMKNTSVSKSPSFIQKLTNSPSKNSLSSDSRKLRLSFRRKKEKPKEEAVVSRNGSCEKVAESLPAPQQVKNKNKKATSAAAKTQTPVPKSSRPAIAGRISFFASLTSDGYNKKKSKV